MSNNRVATALTADKSTQVNIWREVAHTGRVVYIVDFVHMVKRDADRRSMTWKVTHTEEAARVAANECWQRWNGTQVMIAA